ncbi:MAG: transcription antitermination protein NusB [Actinomycetota bacterium]|jgi:N utilization substance protein B|nr:transcription antitermination protein NusB [Actinomycetota bacterium]
MLALDIFYEAEIRDQLPVEAFASKRSSGWIAEDIADVSGGMADPSPSVLDYAGDLVEGVQAHQAEIDSLITQVADRWTIDRMPVIDRNILRLAMYELLWGDDVPVAVAVNEAVEMAKILSTEDSGRFINGVLGKIVDERVR